MSKNEQPDILAALEKATAEDLAKIDKQVAALKLRLDGLVALRRVIHYRLNGNPRRGVALASHPKKKDRPASADGEEPAERGEKTRQQIERIAAYLLKQGQSRSATIANICGVPLGSISQLLKHHYFQKTPDDAYALSNAGKMAVG